MIDEKILNEMEKLKIELYKIQCRNWISSLGKGTGAAGKTLEELLSKKEDTYVLPDYNGIELKTKTSHSKFNLRLFSCACDNKPLEMQRLLDFGGYPDRNNPNFKAFRVAINAISRKKVRKYSYQLYIDENKEVLELIVYYGCSNKIFTIMSWSFSELKSRLEHKLSYMVIVPVRKEKVDNKDYFKYDGPTFYKLKGFKEFLDLINNGKIEVSFNLSHSQAEETYGRVIDRGTSFSIIFEEIPKLFEKLEI